MINVEEEERRKGEEGTADEGRISVASFCGSVGG